MDLQIEKEKLKEYAKKVKGVLWLLGATFAAFLLYGIISAVMFGFMVNPESPDAGSDWQAVLDAVVFGGIIIPLLLPMAILYWRKIRLGTTATKVFTAICTISLIFDLLFIGSMFILRPIHHLFTTESDILSFAIGIGIFLLMANFSRISLLISLLTISENPKRTFRFILLGASIGEIVLFCLVIITCL